MPTRNTEVLARIINERGLARTSLGTLSLTAGAFDDAVSWCVLALVLATFGGGPGLAVLAIGGGLTYVLFMVLFGKRLLAPLGRHAGSLPLAIRPAPSIPIEPLYRSSMGRFVALSVRWNRSPPLPARSPARNLPPP